MRFMWWAPCVLVAIGCDQAASDDPAPDAATIDATVDGQVAPDAAPVLDAAPTPDAAPSDPCPAACARLAVCAVEQCEAIGADDTPAIEEACGALCARTPPVANVINGADCATAVDYGRDQLPALLGEACPGGMSFEPDPLPDDLPCPYPCQDGERCLGGYCVRDDGTCDTDYHCRPDREVCGDDGRCEPAQFAACRGVGDCAEGFECRYFDPDPFADGVCIRPCGGDADCPFGEQCNVAFGNLCYPSICGPGTGNGRLYRECAVGDNPGTCYPLTEGQAQQGSPGFCVEGGTAEVGAPCDNQADERNEASAALRCAPGALCFGDPDDPRNPYDMQNDQGECTRLCDPRDPDATCVEGEVCLDFSTPDDPATAFDEQNHIGVCYRTDCDALEPGSCPEGEACRILTAADRAGRCQPDGQVAVGEPCSEAMLCAGNAVCGGNNRDMQVCVAMCDPQRAGDCPADQLCYADPAWDVGFCIYPAPGQPLPDMGVPEADMGAPEADMAAPEADMAAPEADMAAPEADMGAPEADMAPPAR